MQAEAGAIDPFDPFGFAQGKTFAQGTLSIGMAFRLRPRETYTPAGLNRRYLKLLPRTTVYERDAPMALNLKSHPLPRIRLQFAAILVYNITAQRRLRCLWPLPLPRKV
jgi:hypothetical protein